MKKIEDIVGLSIREVYLHGGEIYLQCAEGAVRLMPEGECCAKAFVNGVDNADALRCATIQNVEDLELTRREEADDDVVDVWGHRIHTDRGICTIDMRTEHNGYYSGWLKTEVAEVPAGAQPLDDFQL